MQSIHRLLEKKNREKKQEFLVKKREWKPELPGVFVIPRGSAKTDFWYEVMCWMIKRKYENTKSWT
jgi:hypothetical protein